MLCNREFNMTMIKRKHEDGVGKQRCRRKSNFGANIKRFNAPYVLKTFSVDRAKLNFVDEAKLPSLTKKGRKRRRRDLHPQGNLYGWKRCL